MEVFLHRFKVCVGKIRSISCILENGRDVLHITFLVETEN